METEWVDVSNLTKDENGNYLSKFQGWLDKLNTLKNRQKFRTRIDRGADDNTTEIYLSHRSLSDVPMTVKIGYKRFWGPLKPVMHLKKRTQTEEERAKAEDLMPNCFADSWSGWA